ncbi:hypothetical protein BD770DRAFT_432178 [Pilaira anomala]|nr:hypothetical protein BD770DRAFT_432178 [Pilaira anomala]
MLCPILLTAKRDFVFLPIKSIIKSLKKYYSRSSSTPFHQVKINNFTITIADRAWMNDEIYSCAFDRIKKKENRRGKHLVMFGSCYIDSLVTMKKPKEQQLLEEPDCRIIDPKYAVINISDITRQVGLVQSSTNNIEHSVISPYYVFNKDIKSFAGSIQNLLAFVFKNNSKAHYFCTESFSSSPIQVNVYATHDSLHICINAGYASLPFSLGAANKAYQQDANAGLLDSLTFFLTATGILIKKVYATHDSLHICLNAGYASLPFSLGAANKAYQQDANAGLLDSLTSFLTGTECTEMPDKRACGTL